MLEGDLVNPFVANVNATETTPILWGAQMTEGQAQVLPQNGGHTYVCVSKTKSCRWMSLWPENNFDTKFMFTPQEAGQSSDTPRKEGPIIKGEIKDGKCNLESAVYDVMNPAPLTGMTIPAFSSKDGPEVCFTAGDNMKYQGKVITLENGKYLTTEGNCAYGVLKGEATWCVGKEQCSVMPANTFFYAGKQGGSEVAAFAKVGSTDSVMLYQACQSDTCVVNNPWETQNGNDLNLPATENASENPIFEKVVEDLCKNPDMAHVQDVFCPKKQSE